MLAAVSALGWVPEPQIRKLGEELQMPRAGLAAVLGAAARSGLIDVRSGYSDGLRAYAVRPPMLADALVAERAFFAPVAAIDLRGLASRWPDHAGELAGAVIRSAVLGAQNARPLAGELLDQALGDAEIFGHVKTSLCLEFIRLDRHAAEHVLRLTGSAAKQCAGDNADGPLDAEGTAKVAGRAAWLYQLEVAIDLLLDASLAEGLPESSRPDHPVRELERLVRVFHPEVPRPVTLRQQIARRTSQWLAQAPDDPARLRVTAAVMQIVLSLGIRSAMPHPGRPNELKMIDTIIPAGEIRQVFQEIWPLVESLLNRERPALAAAAIDVAAEWLRIGGGYDHPFGQDHPQDRLQAAQEAGEELARALAGRDDLSVGTLARLRSVVKRFDVDVAICLPEELAVFFAGTDASGGNWIEAEKVVVEAIRSAADARAGDDPDRVVTLLAEVKAELAYIPRSWPNRTMIAATRLAEVAHDPVEWLHASICHGFMPEGCIFAERLAHENRLSASDARSLLGSRSSRAEIIDILLASEPPSTPITELAADCLRSDDYLLLGKLIGRDRITPVRQSALLARPDPAFRATVAVAIFTGQPSHEDWSPGELKCAWLNALESLCPNHVLGCSGYEMASLYEYLASRYPDTLTRIITRTLSEAGEHHAYASLPHECWDILHRLPAPSKLELWRSFQDQPHMRWLLRPQLVGSDTQWLEQLLTTHEISPDEALGCYIGTQPDIPIRALAKLLIPRGIDPARIAGLRFYGQYSGNLSSWYQSIIDSFEEMSVEEDPDVRAGAGAGIKLFTAQRDQAADNERIQRIRGRA